MKRLKRIGRRVGNGIGLVLATAGVIAVVLLLIVLLIGAVRVLGNVIGRLYSGVAGIMELLGVPLDWTGFVSALLIVAVILFFIGFSIPEDSLITVRGVEPGVQKEEDEYEEALKVNSARGGDG